MTSDENLLLLAANNERQFRSLCACAGHPEWAEDERFRDPVSRAQNQPALRELMNGVFASDTAAAWELRLADEGVPASRVRKITETLAEVQPAARRLLHEIEVGTHLTPIQVPSIGFQLNGHSLGPRHSPHPVGSDNREWPPDDEAQS